MYEKLKTIIAITLVSIILSGCSEYDKNKNAIVSDSTTIEIDSMQENSSSHYEKEEQNQEPEKHKSNLDYKLIDDEPNDGINLYYLVKLKSATDNYRYIIKVDHNKNEISIDRDWYENEWKVFEGGRITGSCVALNEPISWQKDNRGSASFRNMTIDFQENENDFIIESVSGKDDFDLVNVYLRAECP